MSDRKTPFDALMEDSIEQLKVPLNEAEEDKEQDDISSSEESDDKKKSKKKKDGEDANSEEEGDEETGKKKLEEAQIEGQGGTCFTFLVSDEHPGFDRKIESAAMDKTGPIRSASLTTNRSMHKEWTIAVSGSNKDDARKKLEQLFSSWGYTVPQR